jgi:hypothetical protein
LVILPFLHIFIVSGFSFLTVIYRSLSGAMWIRYAYLWFELISVFLDDFPHDVQWCSPAFPPARNLLEREESLIRLPVIQSVACSYFITPMTQPYNNKVIQFSYWNLTSSLFLLFFFWRWINFLHVYRIM